MKRWFTEPLVQFLMLGFLLYAVLMLLAPQQLKSNDQYRIQVDDKRLVKYLQFQAKTFDEKAAQKKYRSLSDSEKDTLMSRYVHDEVLVREALALGLDQNDEVIRRRLMQKIEYINQGFNHDIAAVSEKELRRYFEKHAEEYRLKAGISFTHVFFDSRHREKSVALKMANSTLSLLNKGNVPFSSSAKYGDRFLFKRNYIDQSPDLIRGHFGEGFEKRLFKLKPSSDWQGPFTSEYGIHLILIKSFSASRLPELSEVSSRVLADVRRQKTHIMQRRSFELMREKYTVSADLVQ